MSTKPAGMVLGIETSCDDTSVAVLEDGVRLRAHLIAAQDVHQLYGGVVPELASRAHLELLPPLVAQALRDAGVAPAQLTAIAVTRAPGLVGSLVVGLAFAKAYGLALGLRAVEVDPVLGVVHGASRWLGGKSRSASAKSSRLAAISLLFTVPSGRSSTVAASRNDRPLRMTLSITLRCSGES